MSDHCNNVEDLQEVEVDQRALVNILSRYPGVFDVLRELIQNADDADAHIIDVHFRTGDAEKSEPASIRDVSTVKIRKWIIKNDGGGFQEHDWKRIGKIASGNDNSMKVGAFGVGFYSVLSKSDRPLVKSNGKSLQFDRGDDGKLRKRLADCPTDSGTSIELELRDAEPLPVLADLTRFLVSSVAFLTNIDSISVHLDGQRVLHIEKQVQPPAVIEIPQHLKPTTPLETLTVESIQRTVQRIAVDAEKWAFTSSSTSSSPVVDIDALVERPGLAEEDHSTPTSRSVDSIVEDNAITHDLYTATIHVNLDEDSEMKKGVESSMKSLPSSFKCKVVHFNSEQSLTGIENSHSPKAKQLACLFCGPQGIFPGHDSGRLFIGQSTNQTTGIGLHISAHFLPTMERGAIDLANGQVKAWNKEVLWVGGFLARIIYEAEMRIAAEAKDERVKQLGLCTMNRFAFRPTAPHSGVSPILQEAFFSCCHKLKSPLPVVSDVGISCASDPQFRQNNKDLSFLKKYQVFHEEIELRQRSQIISRYGTPLFKFGDIVREFESGVTQDAMRGFWTWWEDARKNSPSSSTSETARKGFCKEFSSRGVLHPSHETKIMFKNIKFFTFFPLPNDLSPPDTLFVDVTLNVPTKGAVECFGWKQLPLLHWLEYACSQAPQLASSDDSGRDSDVGYRILRALVQFALVEDLPLQKWDEAAELMKNLKCIPTNKGRELPANSYFDDAAVCEGLPVAKESDFLDVPQTPVASTRGFDYKFVELEHAQKVLARIRVHSMMDWEDMVRRLETDASEESNYRLLRYLATIHGGKLTDRQTNDLKLAGSHINDLKSTQTSDLKTRRIFRSESHGLISATELLLPNEDVRKIGLPILALRRAITSLQNDVDPSDSFAVESFIESLGILKYPTLDKIINQAASDNPHVRRPALQHLLSNLETHYNAYKPDDFAKVAFIPTKCGLLACPNEVFASPIWEKLGLKQASEDLYRDLSRLGVKEDPSVDTIIESFKTPERRPSNIGAAADLFEHLHLNGNLPIPMLRDQLSTVSFVPAKNPGPSSSESSAVQYFSPKECFIESDDAKEHYRGIFPFVDFGQNGNSFLESCCAKKSPNASDIVRKITQNPQGYLKALGNADLYLEDLRIIASQLDSISEEDKQAMKKAPMFLAERNGAVDASLLPADQVFISDWESRDFGDNVFVAPKDDILEKMYREMGSEFLGTYVQHAIFPKSYKDGRDPPLNRDQVILRIRCFMKQRDDSGKTDVAFHVRGSEKNLRVKACKYLKLKKTYAPPFGVGADGALAGTVETKSFQMKAGVKLNEDDESYTLWVVSGSSDSKVPHNDIAVALCHVLLKTYGPNDVLLLVSLFAMSEMSLERYYGIKLEVSSPDAKEKPKDKSKNKPEVQFALRPLLAKLEGWTSIVGKQNISAEADANKAIESLGGDGTTPDFSGPCQSHPTSPKTQNRKCKQVHAKMLIEKEDLQDKTTNIRYHVARGSVRGQPSDLEEKIEEFAKLISDLALVFGIDASTTCRIFWKDTDKDLMAFKQGQKLIFLNLAYYYNSADGDEKKVVTEWYLIMAHEIAHNATMDHDEYHGSLSTRLAITRFPALRERFPHISW